MSIVEQVDKLTIAVEDERNFKALEESLKLYHKMIQSGHLKPRENQVQDIYTTIIYNSNYS